MLPPVLTSIGFHLFGVINNAGLSNSCPLELMSMQSLRAQFEGTYFIMMRVARCVANFSFSERVWMCARYAGFSWLAS